MLHSRQSVSAKLLVVAVALGACNVFTDADEAALQRPGGGGDDQGASTGATVASTSGAGGGTSTGGGAASNGATTGTAMGICSPECAANAYCEAASNSCVCDPGFFMQGGVCVAAPVGDPTTHTQVEVCDRWTTGHVVTEPDPLVTNGQQCDAGSLKTGGITDTLLRINMFRWMVGVGPTSNDPALDAKAQLCANLESWWDWNLPDSPHQPPSGVTCYTAEGAATAGESNLAWGSGHPAAAMDQYVQDSGNATTMGHRRWVLYPPLDPIGIGYWKGGGMYGDAQCLRVFGASGTGPNPEWLAFPPPGFVPVDVTGWTWTFHGALAGLSTSTASVVRVDDGAALGVKMLPLQQGYGQDAISWDPVGWSAVAGETYRVTITGLAGGDIVYDVKPVSCG